MSDSRPYTALIQIDPLLRSMPDLTSLRARVSTLSSRSASTPMLIDFALLFRLLRTDALLSSTSDERASKAAKER